MSKIKWYFHHLNDYGESVVFCSPGYLYDSIIQAISGLLKIIVTLLLVPVIIIIWPFSPINAYFRERQALKDSIDFWWNRCAYCYNPATEDGNNIWCSTCQIQLATIMESDGHRRLIPSCS